AAAIDLADAGVEVAAIVDVRSAPGAAWLGRAQQRGLTVVTGHVVTAARGDSEVSAVLVGRPGSPAEIPAIEHEFEADLLLVSGGWNPVVHLFSQSGGALRHDEVLGALVP